ncbi:MAG: ABC transporter ATP-binding protein [Bacillota bacterium]
MTYISMRNITKTFGKVIANKNINLSVGQGEIHSLLGENGAGKSTLMNMLSGIYIPDSGSIFINEQEIKFASPKDSINAGIGMIHQHFKLVDVLTAQENIILGQKTAFFLNKNKIKNAINEIAHKFNLEVDLDKKVFEMSVGEKQNLEILKVMYRGAKILILDEPTAVLTPQETAKLFAIMRRMKEKGCAVIFISHKMNEVMEISDKITVLRKGETVQTIEKDKTNPQELTELMVGHPIDLSIKRIDKVKTQAVLKVNNLRAENSEGVEILKGLTFDLHAGEILSIAGIAGSGQKELCESIAGLYPVKSGEILFKGEDLVGKNPKEIITKGVSMSFIPEDRLGMGLVASMDIVDNVLLKQYQKQKGFLVDRKPAIEKAKDIIKKLDVHTPGIFHPIRDLSGGNIQKVLLGRELDTNPELLITAYPVRGLDINTCHKIYDLLNEEKKKGVAILFIAEDLDSLIGLSDRILVLSNGEITGIVDARKATKEKIGLMMLGEKIEETEGAYAV